MYWALLTILLIGAIVFLAGEKLVTALIRHWAEPGESDPGPDIHVQRDIPYATAETGPLLLDLYRPQTQQSNLPVVLVLFGGGWFVGNKNQPVNKPMQVHRLTRHGYAVAVINYRLSDVASYPAPLVDARAAVRWLRTNADEHLLDPARIACWGFSAGGHLSSMLATTAAQTLPHEEPSATSCAVAAAVSFFGPGDLLKWTMSSNRSHITSPRWMVRRLMGGDLNGREEEMRQASPLHWVSPETAPMLLLHGKKDKVVPVEQSESLYAALRSNDVPAKLRIIPDAGHGSGQFFSSENMIEEVAEFFDEHL